MSVASSWEGGGLTELPAAAAAASLSPCRPVRPALSLLPRSAVGPSRSMEAGTHRQGSKASPASVISCPAKDERQKVWHRFRKREMTSSLAQELLSPVRTTLTRDKQGSPPALAYLAHAHALPGLSGQLGGLQGDLSKLHRVWRRQRSTPEARGPHSHCTAGT